MRLGGQCDVRGDACNRDLVCATNDPTEAGCPISRRDAKTGIRYLDASEQDAIRDELVAMPLATWTYRADGPGAPEHTGFLIDDVEPSAAVRPDGEHVDVYGYTSMAVAAIQSQQREIEVLRAELEALRAELRASKGR